MDKTKKQKQANRKNMIIDMNELQIKATKFETSEITRGVGVQKPKKGKGSYNRKEKYAVCY